MTWLALGSVALNLVLLIAVDVTRWERNFERDNGKWWKTRADEYLADRDRYFAKLTAPPAKRATKRRRKS